MNVLVMLIKNNTEIGSSGDTVEDKDKCLTVSSFFLESSIYSLLQTLLDLRESNTSALFFFLDIFFWLFHVYCSCSQSAGPSWWWLIWEATWMKWWAGISKDRDLKTKQKTEQIIRKMVRMNESDSFVYVFLSLVDMATFFTSWFTIWAPNAHSAKIPPCCTTWHILQLQQRDCVPFFILQIPSCDLLPM